MKMRMSLSDVRLAVYALILESGLGAPRDYDSIEHAVEDLRDQNKLTAGNLHLQLAWEVRDESGNWLTAIDFTLRLRGPVNGPLSHDVYVSWPPFSRPARAALAAVQEYERVVELANRIDAYLSAVDGVLPETA